MQYILVLTLLGAVAGETQGLVGQELIGQGVTGSSNGDTGVFVSGVKGGEWRGKQKLNVYVESWIEKHTQVQYLN